MTTASVQRVEAWPRDRSAPLNLIHRRGPAATASGRVSAVSRRVARTAASTGVAASAVAVAVWRCRGRGAAICVAVAFAGLTALLGRAGARRRRLRTEARIDESVAESFPASDPPATA